MKYLGFLLVGLMMFTFGCNTTTFEEPISVIEQLEIDLEIIDNWIGDPDNQIVIEDTLHHESEIRYTINEKGTGIRAQVADVLRVSYEGRFLTTGEVFDSNTSFDFVLNSGSIILGWYFMLQEMDEGDTFTIYLPSQLAYGARGNGTIPPNALLVFDITLIRVGN